MASVVRLLLFGLAAVTALPYDPVIRKLDDVRYQYMVDDDGTPQLVDLWGKASDLAEAARYNPDSQNVYHLFTRQNPTVSQVLLQGSDGLVGETNFNPTKRTVVLVHGWLGSVLSDYNTVMVPAFLSAADVNVIVVDWGAGGGTINYFVALANTKPSGEGVARFISWLNSVTGASPHMYHLVGHSLGAHQVGIIGRNLGGNIAYITGLDPAFPGWANNEDRFRKTDGVYTEVIHTNAGLQGYPLPLGDVDFYPNSGINMPGCSSSSCDHDRVYFYMAESVSSGGFTGRRCASFITAILGNCQMLGSLRMGGIVPKTGQSGIFLVNTNASPPFSMG